MSDPHIGSCFDSFLEENGIRDEVDALAQKRVIAWQIEKAMQETGIRPPSRTPPGEQRQ